MSRIEVTENIIATKVTKAIKWSDVAAKVGLSKEWVIAARDRLQESAKCGRSRAAGFG